jgi:hypothetical protein
MEPTITPSEAGTDINCAELCKDGCIKGDDCPNLEFKAQAAQFIESTSLDRMIEIAAEAARKKMMAPPEWVFPEE